ncbi:hypothetical protein EVAR_32167_1 [Eumeta japonica]|uniref:Uncharacterized protein n=1 Tax=Eumeta variegata TaxID=151549 RepID=A0A4C1VXQ2_EUMVA|nr:hypothetical protein EVAR_32167_1 [Eumeta japonica]
MPVTSNLTTRLDGLLSQHDFIPVIALKHIADDRDKAITAHCYSRGARRRHVRAGRRRADHLARNCIDTFGMHVRVNAGPALCKPRTPVAAQKNDYLKGNFLQQRKQLMSSEMFARSQLAAPAPTHPRSFTYHKNSSNVRRTPFLRF